MFYFESVLLIFTFKLARKSDLEILEREELY